MTTTEALAVATAAGLIGHDATLYAAGWDAAHDDTAARWTLAQAAACYDALDAEDPARTDTRHAWICGSQAALTNTGRYESMHHEAAALGAQAYTMGYEAGVASQAAVLAGAINESADQLEALGGYTPQQEARADAAAVIGKILAAGGNAVDLWCSDPTKEAISEWLIDVARPLAMWIEHGNRDYQGSVKPEPQT